jgi:AcrR family transcriptional regulator
VFTMTDLRQDILGRACDLYLSRGLDGFSMRGLAKELGVTAPALYRHYEGREAVLADVLRQAHRAFTSYIYRALEAPTPLERLARAGEGYLDFAIEHPRWHAMLFAGAERLGMTALPEDIEAMGCATHQFWIDRVSECMRAGILVEGDPFETSLTMWAHAHGLVQLFHQGHLGKDVQAFRKLCKESGVRLMAGLARKDYEASPNGAPKEPVTRLQTTT